MSTFNSKIPLLKDYLTSKPSITITTVCLSLFLMILYIIIGIIKFSRGTLTSQDTAFGFLVFAFLGMAMSLHYKKRARMGATGLEWSHDTNLSRDENV